MTQEFIRFMDRVFDREPRNTVTVTITGNIYDTDDFKRALVEALKDLDDVDSAIFSPKQ